MPNIISNGSVYCLSTDSNEQLAIPVFNNGATTATNVIVTITLPDGLTFSSDTPSQGIFAELDPSTGEWDVGSLTIEQDRDNPETLDLCLEVTDETQAPFTITWILSCDQCPDQNVANDSASRTIEGIECSQFGDCFEFHLGELEEFDSMAEAIDELGPGQPFLASLENIEGWSYRGVYITPLS